MSFIVSLFKPLAYISLPIILLRSIANTSPVARYYVRSLAYATTLASVASWSVAAAAGYAFAGRKHDLNNLVARIFYAVASRLFKITVEVEGEEYLNQRPAILMANHQSMLDIIVVGRVMPRQTSIVAKESLRFTPLGPFMTMSGAVFVDRGNNTRAIQSLNNAANLIKQLKISIWIFPEGTRHLSEKPDLLPFKKGGFHLAMSAGIPIIPIVTENYWHIYRKGYFGEGVIKVKILPPIPTLGHTDAGALANQVREKMLAALHELSPTKNASSDKSLAPATETVVAASSLSEKEPISIPSSSLPTPGASASLVSASESTISLASSISSISPSHSRNSENGAETEEDEGMILVGRPN